MDGGDDRLPLQQFQPAVEVLKGVKVSTTDRIVTVKAELSAEVLEKLVSGTKSP